MIAKRKIICGVSIAMTVILVCVTILTISFMHNSIPSRVSSQSDYPILPKPTQLDSIPADLNKLVSVSELVVTGTVKEVLPVEDYNYTPGQGTAEAAIASKTGNSNEVLKIQPVTLQVDDVLKGTKPAGELKMVIMPYAMGYSPNFQAGQKMVFFLVYNSAYKAYNAVDPQQGYYYIASDKRVYPAVVTDKNKDTSGVIFNDFKSRVKGFVKN